MTRSHHSFAGRSRQPPTIHIVDSDGVTFKTCTAEVFRPAPTHRKPKSSTRRDPQGLRRPRFSFFIFTCQTARSRSSSPPQGSSRNPHPTVNDNRFSPAVDPLFTSEGLQRRGSSLGQEPKQRRAQWVSYRPGQSGLSTTFVRKPSHTEARPDHGKFPWFWRDFAPYLGHIPTTSCHRR